MVVSHYRSPDALRRCLESLRQSLAGIFHEVFVCDSEAEPGMGRLIEAAFPQVAYRPFSQNVGYAKLVNVGLREARGELLLILNADTLVPPGTVEVLAGHLADHPDVGMVGPRLVYPDGVHQPSAFRFYRPFTIAARRTALGRTAAGRREMNRFLLKDVIGEFLDELPVVSVDWLMASALLVRKAAADSVGPLDERFFMYFEDVDWCRRFWAQGWKVAWVPTARVVHAHGQASKKQGGGIAALVRNPYARAHLLSATKYFSKHGLRPDLWRSTCSPAEPIRHPLSTNSRIVH
ncbi:MAG: glycosyltransferase family 2 protein [Egibacteraceae bacterium]